MNQQLCVCYLLPVSLSRSIIISFCIFIISPQMTSPPPPPLIASLKLSVLDCSLDVNMVPNEMLKSVGACSDYK